MKLDLKENNDFLRTLNVLMKWDDIKDDFNKEYQKIKSQYQIPGFRKGKTPMAIINKKYRTSVVVEEVNKLLQEELYKYITEEKVKVLGSPMPINQKEIDWDSKEDLIFEYEVGLSPEFETFNLVISTASLIAAYFADSIKSNSATPILMMLLKVFSF